MANLHWTRKTGALMLNHNGNQPLLQIYYTAKTLNEMENKAAMQKALIKL